MDRAGHLGTLNDMQKYKKDTRVVFTRCPCILHTWFLSSLECTVGPLVLSLWFSSTKRECFVLFGSETRFLRVCCSKIKSVHTVLGDLTLIQRSVFPWITLPSPYHELLH